jgi:hypothetical protein
VELGRQVHRLEGFRPNASGNSEVEGYPPKLDRVNHFEKNLAERNTSDSASVDEITCRHSEAVNCWSFLFLSRA